MSRISDNPVAKRLLGWEPQLKFTDGLHKTIDWHFASKDHTKVGARFERMLTER